MTWAIVALWIGWKVMGSPHASGITLQMTIPFAAVGIPVSFPCCIKCVEWAELYAHLYIGASGRSSCSADSVFAEHISHYYEYLRLHLVLGLREAYTYLVPIVHFVASPGSDYAKTHASTFIFAMQASCRLRAFDVLSSIVQNMLSRAAEVEGIETAVAYADHCSSLLSQRPHQGMFSSTCP